MCVYSMAQHSGAGQLCRMPWKQCREGVFVASTSVQVWALSWINTDRQCRAAHRHVHLHSIFDYLCTVQGDGAGSVCNAGRWMDG